MESIFYFLTAIGAVFLLFTLRHMDNLHDKQNSYGYYGLDNETSNYKWCKVPVSFIFLCLVVFVLGPVSAVILSIANLIYLIILKGEYIEKFFSGRVDLCNMINIRVSVKKEETK